MPPKNSKKTLQQKGGDSDFGDIQLWGQDQVPASSYKIQLGYLEIPKTIKFDEKWLDTPYRFKSFHDANDEASRVFNGYQVRIVASNDRPYWDAPSYLHQDRTQLKPADNEHWYDIVGVESHKENPYSQYAPTGQPPKLNPQNEYVLSELTKLKTPIQVQSKQSNENSLEHDKKIERPSLTSNQIIQNPLKDNHKQSNQKIHHKQSNQKTHNKEDNQSNQKTQKQNKNKSVIYD